MNDRLRSAGRRALDKLPSGFHRQGQPHGSAVRELRRRVTELESEVQECRRLNRRLAELTDVVQELLIPLAQRDEDMLREYLDRYSASL
jgi:hypothetical protein